jgi:hypothetical protein
MMFDIAEVEKRYGDVCVVEDSKDKIIEVCGLCRDI